MQRHKPSRRRCTATNYKVNKLSLFSKVIVFQAVQPPFSLYIVNVLAEFSRGTLVASAQAGCNVHHVAETFGATGFNFIRIGRNQRDPLTFVHGKLFRQETGLPVVGVVQKASIVV